MYLIKTIFAFIVVINILVFVHEFGHFFTARMFGVTVKDFSLGMGPVIYKRVSKKSGTQYCLRSFPIGGFVQMLGEDEQNDQEGSFSTKKPWQKFIIISAGAIVNILVCIIILIGLSLYNGSPTTTVASIVEGSPLSILDVQEGDRIVSLNGTKIDNFEHFFISLQETQGDVTVGIERDDKVTEYKITPDRVKNNRIIGFVPKYRRDLLFSIREGFSKTKTFMVMMYKTILQLITGKLETNSLSGPIGIAGAIGEVASIGFTSLLLFTAIISLNLGVMNLLPFPALDGGRLVFIFIEMITGKKVPENKEALVHTIGIVLLLLLLVYVSYNDILRLIYGK